MQVEERLAQVLITAARKVRAAVGALKERVARKDESGFGAIVTATAGRVAGRGNHLKGVAAQLQLLAVGQKFAHWRQRDFQVRAEE